MALLNIYKIYKHSRGRDAGIYVLGCRYFPKSKKPVKVRFMWVNLISQKRLFLSNPIEDEWTLEYTKEWREVR